MILMSISFGYSQVLVPENTGYGYDNLTTVQLNALTKKKVGDIYYNADLGYHVKWNGVIFESLASGISGIDPADQDKLNNISITQPVNLDTVESLANSALQTETDPTTTPANIKAKLESLTGTNRLDAFAIKNLSAQETDPNLTKSNVEGLGISYTSLSDVPSVSPPLTFGPGFTRTGDNIVLDNPFTTANETTLNSALQSETDPLYSAWDKDYNDLINRPVNLVTYDPLTAQDVQISVLGGSDSESYILEFDPDGYDYSGEPSGTGTVSQTIIDGDTNAVSGNAVFDGLATKLQAGSNDLGSSNFYVNSDGILALANSNTQSTVFVNPYGSGLIAGNSDDSEIMKLTLSPSSITADLSNSQITSTGATSLITKGYADATYASSNQNLSLDMGYGILSISGGNSVDLSATSSYTSFDIVDTGSGATYAKSGVQEKDLITELSQNNIILSSETNTVSGTPSGNLRILLQTYYVQTEFKTFFDVFIENMNGVGDYYLKGILNPAGTQIDVYSVGSDGLLTPVSAPTSLGYIQITGTYFYAGF